MAGERCLRPAAFQAFLRPNCIQAVGRTSFNDKKSFHFFESALIQRPFGKHCLLNGVYRTARRSPNVHCPFRSARSFSTFSTSASSFNFGFNLEQTKVCCRKLWKGCFRSLRCSAETEKFAPNVFPFKFAPRSFRQNFPQSFGQQIAVIVAEHS